LLDQMRESYFGPYPPSQEMIEHHLDLTFLSRIYRAGQGGEIACTRTVLYSRETIKEKLNELNKLIPASKTPCSSFLLITYQRKKQT
jgi:hypothetical protein